MQQSPTGSFLRFVLGFVTFLALSFTLTIAVTDYTKGQDAQQAAAAAEAMMLR
jgi:hypothetical protein